MIRTVKMVPESDLLELRFSDQDDPEAHIVSVAALAQALEAMQRLTFVLAMRREGRLPGKRIRPSFEIQQRYRLICELPAAGSFVTPIRVQGADLLGSADSEAIMVQIRSVLKAAGQESEAELRRLIPDRQWRRFVLESIDSLAPKANQKTDLEIFYGSQRLVSAKRAKAFAERVLKSPEPGEQRNALVGTLKDIDFERNHFRIRHDESSRIVSAFYDSAIEESLLSHPRDSLIIFGIVALNADGEIDSISDVDHVEEFDRTPIEIPQIDLGNSELLQPLERIVAEVGFDEESALYTAVISTIGVDVFSENREELEELISVELQMLWKHYAEAEDEKLTTPAIALKQRLKSRFQKVANAS